ncbi:MAG: GTPase [Nanoarchaeota archaeon]
MVRLSGPSETHNRHKIAFTDQVRDVIRISDIVLCILDARYVEQSRVRELEDLVIDSGKVLVHVVNKTDLLSKEDLDKLKSIKDLSNPVFISVKTKQGVGDLRRRIQILAKRVEGFEKVHVGVVGYPNVGKSVLLSFLARRAAAPSSPHSGFTKAIRKVRFAKGIHLLDAPGVIPPTESLFEGKDMKKLALLGVHTPQNVKAPDLILDEIVKNFPGVVEKFYELEESGDVEAILQELGQRWKILKKKGEVDEDKTARRVLVDWQEGRIAH